MLPLKSNSQTEDTVSAYLQRKDRVTYVFPNNLLESVRKDAPSKHLDILLNVPRLRTGKLHNELEEALALLLSLGHSQRPEPLQVPAYPVLLLDRKPHPDQRLQEVDTINAGYIALFPFRPPDATDANGIGIGRGSIALRNRSEGRMDGASILLSPELNQPPATIPFLARPVQCHFAQLSLDLQYRLVVGIHRVVWESRARPTVRVTVTTLIDLL